MIMGGVTYTDVISFDKILRMLYQQEDLDFPPGSEYSYSNTGYNLLARVIEVQSGQSFRAYTDERIFRPLGMANTHFSDDYLEIVPGRAESYAPTDDRGYRRVINQLTALASSSLNTTIDDFILWMQNYETAQVGGAELVSRMTEPGRLNDGEELGYAYGLTVGEYRGLPTFGHGGSWAGFRTNFVRFPEQNLSVVVFCNVSNCDPAGRARRVAEVFIEDEMGPRPEPSPGRGRARAALTQRGPAPRLHRCLPQPRAGLDVRDRPRGRRTRRAALAERRRDTDAVGGRHLPGGSALAADGAVRARGRPGGAVHGYGQPRPQPGVRAAVEEVDRDEFRLVRPRPAAVRRVAQPPGGAPTPVSLADNARSARCASGSYACASASVGVSSSK